jgi:RHS repeat-associated protein
MSVKRKPTGLARFAHALWAVAFLALISNAAVAQTTATLISPATSAVYSAPSSVTLTATATPAASTTITAVDFYAGTTLLAHDTTAPYSYTWTSVPVGTYSLTAVATDSASGTGTSWAVSITVSSFTGYTTSFESADGYTAGSLNAQNGWTASTGVAVSSSSAFDGTNAVNIPAASTVGTISKVVAPTPNTAIIYFDFYLKPVADATVGDSTLVDADGAQIGFDLQSGAAVSQPLDGNEAGSGTWKNPIPTLSLPVSTGNQTSSWHRFTVRKDYSDSQWDLYVDGELVEYGLGLKNPTGANITFALSGHASTDTAFDYPYVGPVNPLFADTANDGIPDSWKALYGIPASSWIRNLSPNSSGVPFIEYYRNSDNPLDSFNGRAVSNTAPTTTNTVTYTYDASGRLTNTSYNSLAQEAFTFDSRTNLTSAVTTTLTYDSSGNVLTRTDAAGRVTTWTYNSNSLPLTETLPGGGVNTFAYTNGRLTSLTDPNGVVTTWSYDTNGRALYMEDAASNRTTYTYDAAGNLLTETNPLSQVITRTYDDQNRLHTVTAADGGVTTYAYDNNGNVTSVTDALGHVTTMAYNSEDRITSITDALSHAISFGYNNAGDTTSATNPLSAATSFSYDSASRRTGVTNALSNQTTTAYNSRGLVTSVTDPLSHAKSFGYNDAGIQTSTTDGLSQTTTYTRDALGRVTGVTDPGSLATSQSFSTNGAVSGFTNAGGGTTTFTTDVGGRITAVTTPGSKVTAYAYNSRGLLYTITDPASQTTTLSYDTAGRVSGVVDPVGTAAITRDAAGRQLTLTENGKTLTRTYDLMGRVTSYTDGDGNTIGYTYNNVGLLSTLTYPGSKVVTYGYDAANRMTSVTDWASRVTTYTYDAEGQLTQTQRPNGTKQVRTYDAAGRLSTLTELGADGVTVIYSSTHGYDAADRLTSESLMPTMPIPATGTTTQTFDSDNRIATHNGQTATFDANGNLTALPGLTPSSFTYDGRNRLTAAGGLSYTYDAENHRTGVTNTSGTTTYIVDPNPVLSQVLVKTTGSTITRYVYGIGLIYEETGTAASFYHFSRRGDTVAMTDAAGAVTDRFSYGVYGELLTHTGSSTSPFQFNGFYGVQTDTNGLYHHRARYYSPSLRRFLSQDPIGFSGGLNFYAFVAGNPVYQVDPSGETFDIEDQQSFDKARDYLTRNNPLAKRIFDTLEQSQTIYHVGPNRWNNDAYNPKFNDTNQAIDWDPHLAAVVSEGLISPAQVLLHELAHAYCFDQNKSAQDDRRKQDDPRFENAEERHAATVENTNAKANGELLRRNHANNPWKRVNDLRKHWNPNSPETEWNSKP